MISRRHFVASLAAMTLGTGALSLPVKSVRQRMGRLLALPRLRIQDLKPESFAGLTGTHLTLHAADGSTTRARLADVTGHDQFQKHSARRLQQMSLLFEVPAHSSLSDGLHRVEHPLAGSCDLYLSAVGPVGRVRQFEAVISRLA